MTPVLQHICLKSNRVPSLNPLLQRRIIESMIICDIIKQNFNQGKPGNCFFWRDKNGNEIDCLVDKGDVLTPIEIKSGKTIASDYFKGIDYFVKAAGNRSSKPYLIYGGTERTASDQSAGYSLEQIGSIGSLICGRCSHARFA